MSGRHKFSKLTQDFSAVERKDVENIKAQMRAEIEAEAAKSSTKGEKERASSPGPVER